MLSCAKISLLMFLRRMFTKALRGSGGDPLLWFDGISRGSLKTGCSYTDLWSYEKNLIDLLRYECYVQVLSYLLLKQANFFSFLRPCYHYYQRCINPAAIKIRKHFCQILLPRVYLKEFWFRSNTFSYQCSQCGQQRWYRVYRTCL